VARLRESDAVDTAGDPQDRRRTLVRLSAEAAEGIGARPAAEIDTALAKAIGRAVSGMMPGRGCRVASRPGPRA
jgi:hypothetical protein